MSNLSFIAANWPAPKNIIAGTTTRIGGYSTGPYAQLNLGHHVDDDPQAVLANREYLHKQLNLPSSPCWLNQVHGTTVIEAITTADNTPTADGVYTHHTHQVCAVLTADCLPVLLCTKDGKAVGAAHAGWRGLQAGIIEAVIAKLAAKPEQILAWLGPAIGPTAFEVGAEVRELFIAKDPQAELAFIASQNANKYLANIYTLAKQRLQAAGIQAIYGGDYCTYTDKDKFFSYRRDQGVTGRIASLIYKT